VKHPSRSRRTAAAGPVPAPASERLDPLRGGGVTCNVNVARRGTLGAVVFDRRTGDALALGCHHVLMAGQYRDGVGEVVNQPYTGANSPADRIGTIERGDPRLDCAVVRLDAPLRADRGLSTSILGVPGGITGVVTPRPGMRVVKTGAATGTTFGIIDRVGATKFTVVPARDSCRRPLCAYGDSGAVWIEVASRAAVGLHWGGEAGDRPHRACAYAISRIAARLQVDVVRRTEIHMSTAHAPALARAGARTMLAVRARDGRLRVTTWNGAHAHRSTSFAAGAASAPALVPWRGGFAIAWVDGGSGHVCVGHSSAAGRLQRITQLAWRSRSSPSLAVAERRLQCAWLDADAGSVVIAASTDGIRWRVRDRVRVRTSHAPGLAGDAARLWLACTETAGDRIAVFRCTPGGTFRRTGTCAVSTDDPSAIVMHADRVYVAWRSRRDGRLGLRWSRDGRQWDTPILLRESARTAPALVSHGADLVWCWVSRLGRVVVLRHAAD